MTARYANVSEVPLALAVFLASDYYDYDDTPNTISATTLLKPIRQIVLAARVAPGEGLVNLADMMNLRMGSAIHDAIERAWVHNHATAMAALGIPQRVIDRIRINPTEDDIFRAQCEGRDIIPIYLEQRLRKTFGKWTVTGKFDFIGEGRVQDFKSTSVYTYQKQTNAEKYSLQGSIYRWLDPKKITDDEMDIHYIFTDWKASQQKTDPSYPPKRFLKQTYPLKSLSETELFIRAKIGLIETYMEADESDIPECTDDDLWRSDPVFKYYKSGNTSAPRSTKNFDSKQEAMVFMATNGGVGAIKEVPGQVTACKYCPAFTECTQKDRLIASGDLVIG
jgi:hypothetical protein